MSDDRIESLETTIAHHERQIQDLSDMITSQWKEIDRLKRYIAQTDAKLEEYMTSAKDGDALTPTEIAARDKPPHY